MISHTHKFILLCPQKTGSTSLYHGLREYIDVRVTPATAAYEAKRTRRSRGSKRRSNNLKFFREGSEGGTKHYRLNDYISLHPTIDLGTYQVWLVTRNPWDRLVSWYHWYKSRADNVPHPEVYNYNNPSVTDARLVRHLRKNNCVDFVTNTLGIGLTGRIEQEAMSTDFENFRASVGLPCSVSLPRLNSNFREHHRNYIDKNLEAKIRQAAARDIEQFNYKF